LPRCRAESPAGKLTAVARAWAGGRGGNKGRDDDALTQHADLPDWITRRAAESVVEISEEDAVVVGLFMSLDTQWRFHAMTGMRLGLDYPSIRPTADLLGIAIDPAMMGDLRAMELAALEEFAKAARK